MGRCGRALRVFRRAGETANERGLERVTRDCIDANLEAIEREATIEKLFSLPLNHFVVLVAITGWKDRHTGEIIQPVTTAQIRESEDFTKFGLGDRTIRNLITELETMGLVETWIESKGKEDRVKQIQTTFEPRWVREAVVPYVKDSDLIGDLLRD